MLVSCLVLLTVRAAQGAASEVCRGSEPCSQWRVLMPQLRLTAFRLTGFIRWSCSCEAKAPARAPGGAGFKGQRPLRTDYLHSASLRTPLTSRVIRALAECERAGSGPVRNELWVWLSMAPGVTHRFRCSRAVARHSRRLLLLGLVLGWFGF